MPCITRNYSPVELKRAKFNLDKENYVWLRELTAAEFRHYLDTMGERDTSDKDFLFDVLSKTLVDDNNTPLFADTSDLKANLNVGLSTLQAMQEQVLKLSGVTAQKK